MEATTATLLLGEFIYRETPLHKGHGSRQPLLCRFSYVENMRDRRKEDPVKTGHCFFFFLNRGF